MLFTARSSSGEEVPDASDRWTRVLDRLGLCRRDNVIQSFLALRDVTRAHGCDVSDRNWHRAMQIATGRRTVPLIAGYPIPAAPPPPTPEEIQDWVAEAHGRINEALKGGPDVKSKVGTELNGALKSRQLRDMDEADRNALKRRIYVDLLGINPELVR